MRCGPAGNHRLSSKLSATGNVLRLNPPTIVATLFFWRGICLWQVKSCFMATNQKILLLDDNKDLLMIVQIILKGQGYDTVLAHCIEEAEKKIRIHQPALILMDVFIADQDGREFCFRLKQCQETSDIKVILMSGCDSSEGLIKGIGADDFMLKPFDYNDLLHRVSQQMSVNSNRAYA